MDKKKPGSQELLSVVQYLQRLLNCKSWIDKADELLAGAEALEPHVRSLWDIMKMDLKYERHTERRETPGQRPLNLEGVYFMLIAYALENLFKALIIREHCDDIENEVLSTGGKLPGVAKSHDLISLAKAAHFTINVGDEDLLTRLHWNSVWAGRYPVPVDYGGLKNVKVYSDGKGYLVACFYSNDIDRLNALVQRVRTHVRGALNS
jgi:hypothetical protein